MIHRNGISSIPHLSFHTVSSAINENLIMNHIVHMNLIRLTSLNT